MTDSFSASKPTCKGFKLAELSKNSLGATESIDSITFSFEKHPTIFKELFGVENKQNLN